MRRYARLLAATLTMLLLAACATLPQEADRDIALGTQAFDDPAQGNPIVPGYWGDPSIHKFGNTWYIYATTAEGGEGGAFVWKSPDRQNWTLAKMPFTNATITAFWAPSALEANGKYYLYYSKTTNGMFVADAPTPEGPWTERAQLDEANDINIDPQPFVDDDGKTYLYWGSAGVAKVAELSANKTSFAETPRILAVPNYFEGPAMVKRGGNYILTYSDGIFFNSSYKVRYATSSSPYGPFTEGSNSPILTTTGNINAPGHHSLLSDGGQDYIVYHRHQIPFNTFFELNRQIAIDPITIRNNGTVDDIVATHSGVSGWGWRFDNNLARSASVTASSTYSSTYDPANATDDNNATRWAAANYGQQWLQLDLGSAQSINRVMLAFEFPNEWTQYKIESSTDGVTWAPYIDRMGSTSQTGIITHNKSASVRYLRVTITGFQNFTRLAGITEFKIFR